MLLVRVLLMKEEMYDREKQDPGKNRGAGG